MIQETLTPANVGHFGDGLGADHGTVIQGITGTIKVIWDVQNTKDGKPFQNMVLQSPEGHEVEVKFFDRPGLPTSYKGSKVMIVSKSGNHGMNGVKLKDEDYWSGGKNMQIQKRVVRVTSAAEVVDANNIGTGAELASNSEQARTQYQAQTAAPAQTTAPAQATAPARTTAPTGGTQAAVDGNKAARAYMHKAGALYALAVKSAHHHCGTEFAAKYGLDHEMIQRIASNLYIGAERSLIVQGVDGNSLNPATSQTAAPAQTSNPPAQPAPAATAAPAPQTQAPTQPVQPNPELADDEDDVPFA